MAAIVVCLSHHCVATVTTLHFALLASEFIGVLLVAQQRAVNIRTSIVARSHFKVSVFQQLCMG
jgi:hypothetical protein